MKVPQEKRSAMPFDGFRVGLLFALAGAAVGFVYDTAADRDAVWVGGSLGAVAGILVWQVLLWVGIGFAIVRGIGRWLFRDPYQR